MVMKIVGLTYIDGRSQLYLKPDTALLVNRKPFFLPHFTENISARPCLLVKISRMGRCISSRFAERYYSEYALGINFIAEDMLHEGGVDGVTRAVAFDNSMAVGGFVEGDIHESEWSINGMKLPFGGVIEDVSSAVERVSGYVTLRTGDMVAVDFSCTPVQVKREDVVVASAGGEELLYCKIK